MQARFSSYLTIVSLLLKTLCHRIFRIVMEFCSCFLLLMLVWPILFLRFCHVEASVLSHRNPIYPIDSINNIVGQILSMDPCTELPLQSCKGTVLSQLCKTHSLTSVQPLFCHTYAKKCCLVGFFQSQMALCRSFLLRFNVFYYIIYHLKL